jgi:hypothetical protein
MVSLLAGPSSHGMIGIAEGIEIDVSPIFSTERNAGCPIP